MQAKAWENRFHQRPPKKQNCIELNQFSRCGWYNFSEGNSVHRLDQSRPFALKNGEPFRRRSTMK
jgi:hypothetical protein